MDDLEKDITTEEKAVEQPELIEETKETNETQQPQAYAYTSNGQYGNYQMCMSAIAEQKKHKKKVKKVKEKKNKGVSLAKRMVAATLCGVLFAGAAFGTLLGIEKLTGRQFFVQSTKVIKEEVVSIPTTHTLTENVDPGLLVEENSDHIIVSTTDVSQVVENVMPAVVSIINVYTQTFYYFGAPYKQQGTASGSGIIVGQNDEELLICTNFHVIEGASELSVTFADDQTYPAAVKGTDEENDLAVIAVQLKDMNQETLKNIAIAVLGDSDMLKVGEPVIAIGNALGYGQSVTAGVVSALNRKLEGYSDGMIQTDAAINPGNSGGALLNSHGEVIGINSAKIGGNTIEGIGYAIPINYAEPILTNLMAQTTKIKVAAEEKGYLGITGVNVTDEYSMILNMPLGVYIYQVYDGTGAKEAGLMTGDVITALNGVTITSMADLTGELEYYAEGTVVELKVARVANGYQEEIVQVRLGGEFSSEEEEAEEETEAEEEEPGSYWFSNIPNPDR